MWPEQFTRTTFDDGQRSVDFILVFTQKQKSDSEDVQDDFDRIRTRFFQNLEKEGLDIEVEEHHSGHFFVKVHAARTTLTKYAELLKWQMPVKVSILHLRDQVRKKFASYRRTDFFNEASSSMTFDILTPVSKYRMHYEYSKAKSYLFDENDPNFFTPAIKIVTCWYILQRTSFSLDGSQENNFKKIGIQKLIHERVFVDAYPIHDGHFNHSKTKRGILLHKWGSIRHILSNQPIDEIKHYFGPQIALYFAWLGLYTTMLVPAAFLGVICLLYGWYHIESSDMVKEVCNSTSQFIMCPLCDRKCDYWILGETCLQAKIENLFDNNFTIFFAMFMCLWTTLLLEVWKFYAAHLIHNWGLTNFTRKMEPKRPQNMSESVESLAFDGYTRTWDRRKPLRYILSYSISLLGISLVLATTLAVIIFRMSYEIGGSKRGGAATTMIDNLTAATLNLVIVYFLNYIYYYVAVFLTERELHRTEGEYDENLSLKIYLFQFVNYYSSIFYIAFIKGKFIGHPAKYNRIFGLRQEECSQAGCMADLTLQLAVIVIGKQILTTGNEMILAHFWVLLAKLPHLCKNCFKRKCESQQERSQWILDFNRLNLNFQAMFNEYLEMVIQFGFITLFVVSFPLAPLAALINNVFEVRLDAKKFLIYYRRSIPRRIKGIGSWYTIMQVICRLSVLTNSCIIAFSSNFLPKLVYSIHKTYNLTEEGFINYTRSQFDTRDFEFQAIPNDSMFHNVSICYYKDFRYPPTASTKKYELTVVFWHILAARLAFIVLFQNLVGFVQMFADWAISDVPPLVKYRIRKEEQLVSDFIIKKEKAKVKNRRRHLVSRSSTNLAKCTVQTEL